MQFKPRSPGCAHYNRQNVEVEVEVNLMVEVVAGMNLLLVKAVPGITVLLVKAVPGITVLLVNAVPGITVLLVNAVPGMLVTVRKVLPPETTVPVIVVPGLVKPVVMVVAGLVKPVVMVVPKLVKPVVMVVAGLVKPVVMVVAGISVLLTDVKVLVAVVQIPPPCSSICSAAVAGTSIVTSRSPSGPTRRQAKTVDCGLAWAVGASNPLGFNWLSSPNARSSAQAVTGKARRFASIQ